MKEIVTRRPRRRAALIVAGLAVTSAAWGAAPASAADFYYCAAFPIPEATWCGDGTNHVYSGNSATYSGVGDVWVCQRLLYADTATQVEPPTCAYNHIDRAYPAPLFLTEAEVMHNTGTGAQRTILGHAIA